MSPLMSFHDIIVCLFSCDNKDIHHIFCCSTVAKNALEPTQLFVQSCFSHGGEPRPTLACVQLSLVENANHDTVVFQQYIYLSVKCFKCVFFGALHNCPTFCCPCPACLKSVDGIKGELLSISTCSLVAQATLDLPVAKTRTLLVHPLQGSSNGELALTASSVGSELYTVF